jgi:hypothetical protein
MQDIESMQQQIGVLSDSSKQHWERICQLTSQVDTMQAFYKAYGEFPGYQEVAGHVQMLSNPQEWCCP